MLLLTKRKSGLLIYGVAMLFALGWGVFEVGLYWWGLAPRGGPIVLVGLFLLLPAVARSLTRGTVGFRRYGIEGMALVGAVVISTMVASLAMVTQPYDNARQFAAESMAAAPVSAGDVTDGEWASYGRMDAGQRYSPLAQIRPNDVADLEVAWEHHAGDVHEYLPGTALQSTPLIIGDTMYLCTPKSELIARTR